MQSLAEILEIAMLIAFGLSWPTNGLKAWRARTAKGTSIYFLLLIFGGYICGIAAKLIGGSYHWYVLFFYVLNLVTVFANIVIYFRNCRLDKQAASGKG